MLFVTFSNVPGILKAHAIFAKALELRGYRPVFLTSSGSRWAYRYLQVFGFEDIIAWDRSVTDTSTDLDAERFVASFLADRPTVQDVKTWTVQGVDVGKHALSSAIRAALRGRFDPTDPNDMLALRPHLIRAVRAVPHAYALLDDRRFDVAFVRDSGYVPNGIIFDAALRRGVDVIRGETAQMKDRWLLKRYTWATRGRALWSLSPETWNSLKDRPLTTAQRQALAEDFATRDDPTSVSDLYRYQRGKRELAPEDVRTFLQLDPRKRTAVIFSHISWDGSFFDGEDVYDDYEHWLVETVRLAAANPRLNWIVKMHPANAFKLARERNGGIEAERRALDALGALPSHVSIISASDPVNTRSLFSIMDFGLTVRGTIGAELPCFGIPVVTAGTGRYDGYGFTIDPRSREEYSRTLSTLHQLPQVEESVREAAERHAYWLFIGRQACFPDVLIGDPLKDAVPSHPLVHNTRIVARSRHALADSPSMSQFADWVEDGTAPDLIAP